MLTSRVRLTVNHSRELVGPERQWVRLAFVSLFPPLLLACRAKTVDELRTTGTIVGTITDAENGAPVEKMVVQMPKGIDLTDDDGRFAIHHVRAGKVVVRASRRDRTPTSAGVTVVPGQVATVTLRSTKAALPCCRLAGAWNLTLIIGAVRSQLAAAETSARDDALRRRGVRAPRHRRRHLRHDPRRAVTRGRPPSQPKTSAEGGT